MTCKKSIAQPSIFALNYDGCIQTDAQRSICIIKTNDSYLDKRCMTAAASTPQRSVQRAVPGAQKSPGLCRGSDCYVFNHCFILCLAFLCRAKQDRQRLESRCPIQSRLRMSPNLTALTPPTSRDPLAQEVLGL